MAGNDSSQLTASTKRRQEESDSATIAHEGQLPKKIKVAPNETSTVAKALSPLELCLTQYDIVKRIARHSNSIDIYCLAKASRTAWKAIHETEERWKNLAARTSCCG